MWLTSLVKVTGDEATCLPEESASALNVFNPSASDTAAVNFPAETGAVAVSVLFRTIFTVVTPAPWTMPKSVRWVVRVVYPPGFEIWTYPP